MNMIDAALPLMILAAAALYAAVGHAGGSGYIAAMALSGMAPAEIRPAALCLNILVASIATFKYCRAGHFSWPLFWPLALLAIPAAYAGGSVQLAPHLYRPLLGVVLLYSAWRLLSRPVAAPVLRAAPRAGLLAAGSAIGLVSGISGVGGGIFLSPLLLFGRFATMPQAAAVAAPFILVNSIAGLLGLTGGVPALPAAMPAWALAAIAGGYAGAAYGSRRQASALMVRVLALVLVVAGLKMLLLA